MIHLWGTGAHFSACGLYRYLLWRRWSNGPMMMGLMLNPSTADAMDDDPTVHRCRKRAEKLGYGGLIVCNIFALRSTDPAQLYSRGVEPVGEENNDAILFGASAADRILCAWGNHGGHLGRAEAVLGLLEAEGHAGKLVSLGVTKVGGHPRHPLYVAYADDMIPFEIRRAA